MWLHYSLCRFSKRGKWSEREFLAVALRAMNLTFCILLYLTSKQLIVVNIACSSSIQIPLFVAQLLWICSGEYDVIFDGIHENILQLHYHDPLMQKTVSLQCIFKQHLANFTITTRCNFCYLQVKCFNSLGISDLLHQYIMRTQQIHIHGIYVHNCFLNNCLWMLKSKVRSFLYPPIFPVVQLISLLLQLLCTTW